MHIIPRKTLYKQAPSYLYRGAFLPVITTRINKRAEQYISFLQACYTSIVLASRKKSLWCN